ncbi:MAG: hypothetical protein ABFC94_14720 [Syntrophomonas sp.]
MQNQNPFAVFKSEAPQVAAEAVAAQGKQGDASFLLPSIMGKK